MIDVLGIHNESDGTIQARDQQKAVDEGDVIGDQKGAARHRHLLLSDDAQPVDAMGQQDSYDSEKPEDKDKELGKSLGEKIGKEVNVTIDKTTGNTVAETPPTPEKEEEQDNPFAGMKEMFGAADSEAGITQSAFFIIPAGKKAGDSWTDSVAVSDAMKGSKTYTIKSINGTEAVITVFSKMEGKQNIELQGMQIDIALSAKTEGELLVDTKTSLLKKSSRVADVTGNMDMMGQSMPITSKLTETTEYK